MNGDVRVFLTDGDQEPIDTKDGPGPITRAMIKERDRLGLSTPIISLGGAAPADHISQEAIDAVADRYVAEYGPDRAREQFGHLSRLLGRPVTSSSLPPQRVEGEEVKVYQLDRARPVNPITLPDVRRKLIAAYSQPESVASHADVLAIGKGSMCPYTTDAADAAIIMNGQEIERLSHARIYHLDKDDCALAAAKASRPRAGEITGARIPGWEKGHRYGFMVFDTPIVVDQRRSHAFPAIDLDVPIVAVSWGPWAADYRTWPDAEVHPGARKDAVAASIRERIAEIEEDLAADIAEGRSSVDLAQQLLDGHRRMLAEVEEREDGPVWRSFGTGGNIYPLPGVERVWITFYSPGWQWDTEMFFPLGITMEEVPQYERSASWFKMVVAAWDMFTQGRDGNMGRVLVEPQVIRRKPSDRRADRRRGIEDDGDVTLVRVASKPRPRPAKVSEATPAGHDDGDGYVWTERRYVEVDSYDRTQCPNTRRHKDDPVACTRRHETITIPWYEYTAGPPGAPLRVPKEKVYQPPKEQQK